MHASGLRIVLLTALAALMIGGCTAITDIKTDISERMFGRELADPPGELAEITAKIQPKIVWSYKIGVSQDYDFAPATENGAIYVASASGEIAKVDAATGKQAWRINTGEILSGGVGLGANLVLLGTPKGQVIAYDQSGKLLWKSKVSSEVLSVPRVDGDTVVVRCGDSRIFGINAADGARKWIYERATPALSLRSSAGVAVDSGAVYAGFAGGKLIALRADDGKVIWEVSVAQPKGATEIERIADITSLPVVDGPLVYAVAYQGKVAAIDRAAGRVAWSRDISSYTGLNSEEGRIYVSHSGGAIYALDYSTGKTYWRQGELLNRRLSAPLPMGGVIAFGDIQGYLHFLDREDGSFSGRLRTEDSPILPQMTALGSNGLLAQTRNGVLYAISLK
ncbi:MAG TPA: outer membrane protein assembly factor BamB [Methylophilaceae bacterium]|nr:outer membrane protein assembly factor BamB [Methylophilaceae bacterium]